MRTHPTPNRICLAALPLVACAAFLLLPGAARAQSISLAFSKPENIEAGKNWDIAGSVIGAEDMASALCRYRTEATGRWEQVSMVLEYDDFFRARVPGRDIVQPGIEFYCVAKDYFGGRFDILGSANHPERLKVVAVAPKAAPVPAAAAEEKSASPDEPMLNPDEAFDSADDEGAGSGDDDFAAEAARSARKAMEDSGQGSAKDQAPQPIEITPSEPASSTGSDEGIRSSFGNRTAAGPRVQEFPSQDLAPGEIPGEDASAGEDPPRSQLSSSKNIRTKTQRTVADFSPEPVTLYGAEDVVSLASNKSETVTLAPAIASGVSEDQMRDIGLLTLPDVLKTIPGMETSRDVQGFHRVAIRGIFDDAALLVMYDGHRLNNAYDAKTMLNLSTENLEQVEVLRGPGSALHGSGATLGTINLLPKRRTGIHGAAMGGLQGTGEAHLSGGLRFGQSNWYLYGDASYRRTDGYREEISQDTLSSVMENAGKKNPDDPAGITDDHGQWVNAALELRRSRAGGGTTRAFARVLYEDRGALVGLYDVVGADSELSWLAVLADVTHSQPFSIGNLNVRLFFDHQSVDRRFQVAPKGYPLSNTVTADAGLFEETKFTTQSFGFDASMDFKLGKTNRLTAGITGEMQRLPSHEYTQNVTDGGAMVSPFAAPLQSYSEIKNRLVGAVLLQDFWQIHPTFSLTAGLRLDATQLPNSTEKGDVIVPDGTRFVPSINPRIGLVWSPASNWTLKLLYGRAFRAPTMQELSEQITDSTLTQGRSEGNPALRPAIIDTVEASVETTLPIGLSRLRIRANGFFNNLSDPIMAVDVSGNVSPLENRDLGVRVFGAEGELRFEFTGSRAYTFVNCSWFRAEDQAVSKGLNYLTNVPQIRFNWAALLPIGPYLNFSLLAQYGAERRNNARSVLEAQRSYKIPPYIIVGAQLSTQRLANVVEFALTAKNVFNFKNFDEVPRPDSGRMPGLLPREGFNAFLTARFFY